MFNSFLSVDFSRPHILSHVCSVFLQVISYPFSVINSPLFFLTILRTYYCPCISLERPPTNTTYFFHLFPLSTSNCAFNVLPTRCIFSYFSDVLSAILIQFFPMCSLILFCILSLCYLLTLYTTIFLSTVKD